MSTNHNSPLSDEVSSPHALPASRTALAQYQDVGWSSVAALAETPQVAALNLAPYLHALRRHWILATAVGLFCAAIVGPVVWFWVWPAQYLAVAYIQVSPSEERLVSLTGGREYMAPNVYDTYKNTQAQTIVNPVVLIAALRDPDVAKLKLDEREDDPVTWLQDELSVTFPGESEIMEVGMKGDDAKEMATIVKAVVNAYLEEVVNRKTMNRRKRLAKLGTIQTKHQDEIRADRNTLLRLAEQFGMTKDAGIEAKQQSAMREYSLFSSELIKAQLKRMQVAEEMKSQKELLAAVDSAEISDAEVDQYARMDPQYRRMLEDLALQQSAAAQAQATIKAGAESSYVQRSRAQLGMIQNQMTELRTELRNQIRSMRRTEYERAILEKTVEFNAWAAQEKQLQEGVKQQAAKLEEIGGSSVELEMTQQRVDNSTQVLSRVGTEIAEVEAELQAEPSIRVLNQAVPPLTEDALPVRAAVFVLAVVVAFCIPVGGIVWWDTRAKRINTAEDVSKGIGLTVLGSVPMIPARVIPRLDSAATRYRNWRLRLDESVDGVAARLLRKAEIEQIRVVLVTSAVGGEAKTTMATQLARSLARSGHHTVLVDFDLRRPAFDEAFGLPLEPGVSDALRGDGNVDPPVHETETDNLAVLTAGRWDRHALAALANGAAGAMFEKLRAEYEFIVVDASPVLPVADTRFVSQYVDTVILSVFRDLSQAPKVEAAHEILEAFGCRSVEAVVTGLVETMDAKDLGYEPRLLESA